MNNSTYKKILVLLTVILAAVFIYLRLHQLKLVYAVMLPFVAAFIIAYVLNPIVTFLEKQKFPRPLAVMIIFLIFFGSIAFLAFNIIPAAAGEIQDLIAVLPDYTLRLQEYLQDMQRHYHRFNIPENLKLIIDESIKDIEWRLLVFFDGLTERLLALLPNFIIFLILPVLVFYFLRDFNAIKKYIKNHIPHRYRHRVNTLVREMDITLGKYIRGIFLISFLVGSLTYFGLALLGVEFALILGIISGITNVIPYFGPIIGSIPALAVAFTSSSVLALKVLVLMIVVQQIESQLISPPILGKTLKLHPLVILFVLLLGGRLFGPIGLIISVPLTAMLRILFEHLRHWYKVSRE